MRLLRFLTIVIGLALCRANAGTITNDTFLRDTSGNPIYAQGGGVFKFNGIYYWYGLKYNGAVTYATNPSAGENSDTSFNAFTCYSSTNLVDWKFENNIMTSASPGMSGTSWVGRMGVAYNPTTQKYVLLSQFDGNSGSGELFATCSTPTGNFVFDHVQTTLPVVNNTSGDQTVFLDTDGTAYLICSSANGRAHLYVLPLHPADYLNVDAGDNIYNGNGREGNMMFKNNGRYYFCSSDLHGWNASHCYVVDSTNVMGTYSSEYIMNKTDMDFCHVTQTGFGVTLTGTNGATTFFVGDRWCDFAGNGIGYNQWCPVSFNGSTPTFESLTVVNFDAAAGTWSVGTGNNYILNPGYEADRVTQTDVAGWTNIGAGYGNVSSSHNPGNWHFHHSNSSAYTATTDQLVTNLPSATYNLSVWYKSSGGQTTARIFARNFGGTEKDSDVSAAQANWTQVTITNIVVTNGQCDVGLYSVAAANQSVDIDDWSLMITAPAPPTGLMATSGNGQVPLNWNTSLNATGYNVKRSTTNGGPYTVIASPATNGYADTSVINGTTYYYVVSATNTLGESPNSLQVSVVPSAGPIISAASATPNPVFPGQNVTISATATAQAHPIGSITVDISSIGGVTNQILVSNGAGNYTNTVTVDPATSISVKTLTVNGVDNVGNISSPFTFLLAIGSVNTTWDGGADNDDWGSDANWVGDSAPGFGYSLIFTGTTRLTPLMDSAYNVYAMTFDGSASAFNISTAGGALTLTGGVTNNSPNAQMLNVPVVLGAPATINAASADVSLGQAVNNGGNALTIIDGGHNTTVNGAISGGGGLTKIGAGTNTLSSANTFGGNITISNGTLNIAAAGQLGGGFYSGSILDNGALTYNSSAAQTLAGVVSGTGALNKTGSGPLTLSAPNTFTSATLLNNGTLQLANALALQNSTLNFVNGSLAFSGIPAATLGGLNSAQNISLVNLSSAAVALTVGNNNSTTTYSGSFSGSGSLIKAGTGTFTLTGTNTFSGGITANFGTLEVPANGVVNCGALTGQGFLVDGGTLTSAGTTTFNAVNNAFLQTSGTSYLGDLTEPNSDSLLVKVTGGTFSATSLTLRRTQIFTTAPTATAPIAGSTTTGLYVDGASADVRLGSLTIGTGNSSDSVRLDAGSLTVTNKVLVGNTSNTRWEILQVNSGNFTSLDTVNGIVLSQSASSTANNSEFYVSGGTATAEKIAFGVINDIAGSSGFVIINGGTLYLGSGSIVRSNTGTYASTISLLSGTLGAKADWSSTLPMQLSGANFTIKSADAANTAHNITLPAPLTGAGNLIKTGAGTLTLAATNTYTGGTTVNTGKLVVNGILPASGSTIIANGGTLGGIGIINGATTIQSGGTLAPGNSIGTLTFSSSLTLAAGCTNFFEINHSPLTNDLAKVSGALNLSGTLIVTNIGVSALASGDTFKLFNAGSYNGTFANVILPSLGANLAWNTNGLNTNGVISVVTYTPAPPAFGTQSLVGNNFIFGGFSGYANATFYLIGATNLTTPSSNWARLMTNQFDSNGNFRFTNTLDVNTPQQFFRIALP